MDDVAAHVERAGDPGLVRQVVMQHEIFSEETLAGRPEGDAPGESARTGES